MNELIILTKGTVKPKCPPQNDFEIGDYNCKDGYCIMDNKIYSDLETAWEQCQRIRVCTFIIQLTDGTFRLRKSDDMYVKREDVKFVKYQCPGNMIINISQF